MPLNRREMLLAAAAAPKVIEPAAMPVVPFGKHSVSRLIVGGNPVSGNSHVSNEVSREMRDYFTAGNTMRMLRDCERAGINAWQSRGDRHILRLLNEHRLEGGRIQWIAQTASELADIPRNIQEMAAAGAIGIYHHGSKTDALWQAGKIDDARQTLQAMRQAGVRVGLGTHIPEVIDYVESKNWDVDFYMTCVYRLGRSRAEASRLAGRAIEGEFFYEPDRERMLETVRQTAKQCLIFKVYGASRRCTSREDMRRSLAQVFRYAKPHDCVVIGMFPKRSEQVMENARLVIEAAA